jgi:hypothetical protein
MPLLVFPYPFSLLTNVPFFTSLSFVGATPIPNLTLANAFPSGLGVASTSLGTINPHFSDPYIQQWNVSIQRELPGAFLATVGYLGNHGVHLANTQAINAPPAGPGDVQSRRPYPAFSSITSFENFGASKYNAGFVKIERRFSGGFTLLTSYTFSKLLDMGGINSQADIGTTLPTQSAQSQRRIRTLVFRRQSSFREQLCLAAPGRARPGVRQPVAGRCATDCGRMAGERHPAVPDRSSRHPIPVVR